MQPDPTQAGQLIETSKGLVRRLMIIGENRLELLMVEVQEERERLLPAILLALGLAAFGLLAGVTLTGTVVGFFWEYSRVAALWVLTGLYGAAAACLYQRFMLRVCGWQHLPATLDQLRKDRACLEKNLA
jgi:uncharacterized membrane protein YqjE